MSVNKFAAMAERIKATGWTSEAAQEALRGLTAAGNGGDAAHGRDCLAWAEWALEDAEKKVIPHPKARQARERANERQSQLPEKRPLQGYTVEQYMHRPRPDWIVDGILPQAELSFIVGEWGTGKSFLALDMAGAVARGALWRDCETQRMRVVYVVAEGAGSFQTRLAAYCQHNGIDFKDLDIIVVPDTPNLLQKNDVKALVEEIQRYRPVGWVIVDTLAQTTAGGNENSGEDMGTLIANCKALSRAFNGANVTLVHHQGKDLAKGARGWSGLIGAADTEITLTGREGLRTATISKQKEGQANITLQFRLIAVEIGKDAKGKPITSCVVDHDQRADGGGKAVAEPGGVNQRVMLRIAMGRLEMGDRISIMDLITASAEARVLDPAAKKDRRRESMTTALQGLEDGGWLKTEDGMVLLGPKYPRRGIV